MTNTPITTRKQVALDTLARSSTQQPASQSRREQIIPTSWETEPIDFEQANEADLDASARARTFVIAFHTDVDWTTSGTTLGTTVTLTGWDGECFGIPNDDVFQGIDYILYMSMTTTIKQQFTSWKDQNNMIADLYQHIPPPRSLHQFTLPRNPFRLYLGVARTVNSHSMTLTEAPASMPGSAVLMGKTYLPAIHAELRQRAGKWTEEQAKLALALALPLEPETECVRMATSLGATPTACLKLVGEMMIGPTTGITTGAVPAGQLFVATFRNPLRAAVILDPNPASSAYYYSLLGTTIPNDASASMANPPTTTFSFSIPQNVPYQLPLAWAQCAPNYAYAPHGQIMYLGTLGNTRRKYFWLDVGATVTITLGAISSTAGWSINFYKYFNGVENMAFSYNASGSSVGFAFTQKGAIGAYIAIELSTTLQQNNCTCNTFITGSGPVFCHLSVPELPNLLVNTPQWRTVGTAHLVSNLTPVLNLGGTMSTAVFPGDEDWQQAALGGYNYVSSRNASSERPQPATDPGLYKPLLGSGAEDFNLRRCATGTPTQLYEAHYDLSAECPYATTIMVLGQAGNGPTSSTFTVHYGGIYEAVTTSQALTTSYSKLSIEQTSDVILTMQNLQASYPNPLHVAAILSGLMSAAKAALPLVAKYAPAIGSTIGNLANTLSGTSRKTAPKREKKSVQVVERIREEPARRARVTTTLPANKPKTAERSKSKGREASKRK